MPKNIKYAILGLMIVGTIQILLGGFTLYLPAILKSLWGVARTSRETLIFKYSLLIGIGLIFIGALDFFIALIGLRQLKIWGGICAVFICLFSGVFFLLPIQPLNDLTTSIINFGIIAFILRDWSFLGEGEE